MDDLENHHVRAAKMIYNIRQDNLTNEKILEQVDWKPIGDIYKKRILTLMHDVYYTNVPQDLQNLFTLMWLGVKPKKEGHLYGTEVL